MSEGVTEHSEPVEVARAYDPLEATVWKRQLEQQGIEVTTKRVGGILRAILYLGRVPVSVRVPPEDAVRALEYLKKHRFIV